MKTKTKIFFNIIFLISICIFPVAHGGFSSSTFIDSSQEIWKEHGENRLLNVHEDYISNPFSSSQIVQNQLNGVTSSYSVDGRIFSGGHPLYFSANSFATPDFITDSPGILTRVEYLENTYSDVGGIITPNQSVRTRKHYQVSFNFDTTAPTAGDLELYNDQEGTESFQYQGGWINSPKYYTMYCHDSETGCKCNPLTDTQCEIYNGRVRLIPQILGHLAIPTARFTNNVDLSSIISGNLPDGTKLLYDGETPDMHIRAIKNGSLVHDFNTRWIPNRDFLEDDFGNTLDGVNTQGIKHFRLKNTFNKLAEDNIKIAFRLEDIDYDGGVSGVSGIESYSIKVEKKVAPNSLSEVKYSSGSFLPYNPDGTITGSDMKFLLVEGDFFQNMGEYILTVDTYDFAGNHTKIISDINVHPHYPDYSQSSISVEERELFDGKVLADNKSYLRYTVRLRDRFQNPIYSKQVSQIEQNIEGFTNGKTIYLDMISKSGGDALRIKHTEPILTNSNGVFEFDVYSYTPGTFTQRFNINFNLWNNEYQDNSIIESLYLGRNIGYQENQFITPLSGSISLEDELPQLGKQQKYSIEISNPSNLIFSNAVLEVSNNTLDFSTPHRFREVIINNNRFTTINPKVTFTGSIDITQESAALTVPKLQVNNLPVRYTLSGKNVRYALASLENNFCEIDNISTLGVSIIGNLQGSGRGSITGQTENITDISVVDAREQIRRNALNLISGRSGNGDIVNNIKYISSQNITLNGNQDYDTLIVRNGNVVISGNITKNLGIIVIKDTGYNLRNDYNISGNIFVSNTVSEIDAIIYADGTIRSAKSNGEFYSDAELGTSLLITGAIFTRNTIGGAVGIDNNYLLPGGGSTGDFSLAEVYDLNFLRKTNLCNSPYYSLRIEYNQTVISNPPPGF